MSTTKSSILPMSLPSALRTPLPRSLLARMALYFFNCWLDVSREVAVAAALCCADDAPVSSCAAYIGIATAAVTAASSHCMRVERGSDVQFMPISLVMDCGRSIHVETARPAPAGLA